MSTLASDLADVMIDSVLNGDGSMVKKIIDTFFIPQQKTRWVEWIDEADPDGLPFRAKVRSNLTFDEVNDLVFETETPMTEVHEKLAPHVVEWNAGRLNEQGEPEAIPAPADGDSTVFQQVPNAFFWWLFTEIKMHGSKQLPKASSQPAALSVVPKNESAKASEA